MGRMQRREFMKMAGLAGAAVAFSGVPSAMAADEAAEQKAKVDATIKQITGGKEPGKGGLELKAPTIAENGAVVPVTIQPKGIVPGRLFLIVDENPIPLILDVKVSPKYSGDGAISSRIRMRKTSTVRAYAFDSKGSLYGDFKTVKVTIGGCG
ncbi:MAG: thiosulfate oxidation carrier protein SoxY [Nitrospinae bacterium]|nr:thiosulfate oxidation carrier protein SoxY [Nitrospinota bacterium]